MTRKHTIDTTNRHTDAVQFVRGWSNTELMAARFLVSRESSYVLRAEIRLAVQREDVDAAIDALHEAKVIAKSPSHDAYNITASRHLIEPVRLHLAQRGLSLKINKNLQALTPEGGKLLGKYGV